MTRFPSAAFSKIFTKPSDAIVPSTVTTTTEMNMTITKEEEKNSILFQIQSNAIYQKKLRE